LSSLTPPLKREKERERDCCRRTGERKERGRAGKYDIYGG